MSAGKTLQDSPNAALNKTLLDKYLRLPISDGKIQAMYVWIDGTCQNVRAKTRTLEPDRWSHSIDYPVWNYDGSSTYQSKGVNSDTYLCPVTRYQDPFRPGGILVLCDTYKYDMTPTESNHRKTCAEAMNAARGECPMFGVEQQYTLLDVDGRPLGWPKNGYPAPQGPYYCGVGADKVIARDIVEAHYRACLYAGVNIFGSNAERMLGQWEFQIGPSNGPRIGDDLWIARFLLHRIAEEFGVVVSFDPKPVPGDWNGSGAHFNFSTEKMRKPDGIVEIEKAIEKLSKQHSRHIRVYDPKEGKDNERRLTGKQISSINDFTSGVADRAASIRIPNAVAVAKKGYLQDRRPASNCDPYSVSEAIVRTVCLDE